MKIEIKPLPDPPPELLEIGIMFNKLLMMIHVVDTSHPNTVQTFNQMVTVNGNVYMTNFSITVQKLTK